jgi:glycosyltransferase involved in cell wall biosynthesis
MGQNARRRVEDVFSWTAIAEETLRFYKDLVAEKEVAVS